MSNIAHSENVPWSIREIFENPISDFSNTNKEPQTPAPQLILTLQLSVTESVWALTLRPDLPFANCDTLDRQLT